MIGGYANNETVCKITAILRLQKAIDKRFMHKYFERSAGFVSLAKTMRFDHVKQLMNQFTQWRIPGNSISIWVDNKEIFRYSSGYADLEQRIPMQGNELFNIYSCSKVATAVAALQLYEKGLFLLDDPLYDFIPEYREMYVKTENGLVKAKRPITLRHLFTMTSGLSYDVNSAFMERAQELTKGKMNTLTVAKCLAAEPLCFEPGAQWLYSLSHDVLAAVVEVISGQRFRDYVQENIFDPLEMQESCYHNHGVMKRMAQQYRYLDPEGMDSSVTSDGKTVCVGKEVQNYVFGDEYDSGGAGVTSSVSDYSKFAAALANDGMGFNGERILSSRTIDFMRLNQLNQQHLQTFFPSLKGYGYGLGVRTLMDPAQAGSNGSYGEFGWDGAAGSFFLSDPSLHMSFFYAQHMLNLQGPYCHPKLKNVIYACL